MLHAEADTCTGHRATKVSMHAQDPYSKLIILLNTIINFYGINSIAYLFSTPATRKQGAELGDFNAIKKCIEKKHQNV